MITFNRQRIQAYPIMAKDELRALLIMCQISAIYEMGQMLDLPAVKKKAINNGHTELAGIIDARHPTGYVRALAQASKFRGILPDIDTVQAALDECQFDTHLITVIAGNQILETIVWYLLTAERDGHIDRGMMYQLIGHALLVSDIGTIGIDLRLFSDEYPERPDTEPYSLIRNHIEEVFDDGEV